MRRARHVANRLLTIVVWVVALVCFGLLGFIGVGPRTGRYQTLTVLSGSMRPGIAPGAVVIELPEPASSLRVGQIISYPIPVDDHHVITHRVVRIIRGGDHPVFQTKGDDNDAADPWQAQVTTASAWRVRVVVPGLGFGVHWLRARTIHVVGVMVLPTILAVWWVVSIWRDDEEPDADAVAGVAAS